jgi:hypothetical protein
MLTWSKIWIDDDTYFDLDKKMICSKKDKNKRFSVPYFKYWSEAWSTEDVERFIAIIKCADDIWKFLKYCDIIYKYMPGFMSSIVCDSVRKPAELYGNIKTVIDAIQYSGNEQEVLNYCETIYEFSSRLLNNISCRDATPKKIYEAIKNRYADVVKLKVTLGVNDFYSVILYRLRSASPARCSFKVDSFHVGESYITVKRGAFEMYISDCVSVPRRVLNRMDYVSSFLYKIAWRLVRFKQDIGATKMWKDILCTAKDYKCEAAIDPKG